jgi:hypothetical protein
MIAPGMRINATNQTRVNVLALNTSNVIHCGYGFKNVLGEYILCMDSDPPVGQFFNNGFRVSKTGAIYIKFGTDPTDVWHSGLRRTPEGILVIEDAVGTSFVNGNPLTANGVFAVTLV